MAAIDSVFQLEAALYNPIIFTLRVKLGSELRVVSSHEYHAVCVIVRNERLGTVIPKSRKGKYVSVHVLVRRSFLLPVILIKYAFSRFTKNTNKHRYTYHSASRYKDIYPLPFPLPLSPCLALLPNSHLYLIYLIVLPVALFGCLVLIWISEYPLVLDLT
jgi:hypothetical protein